MTEVFTDALSGPVVTRLPRLRDWWSLLLAPVRESGGTFEDDEEVELTDDDLMADAAGHSDLDYAQARRVLTRALAGPVRLSQLLADAMQFGPAVADVLALTVLAAFAPDPEGDDEEPGVHDLSDLLGEHLVVLDDGACFDDGLFGGSDLLVVPARSLIGEELFEEAVA
ncbi:hypothetical protein GTX14_15740 [Streptomyces sp. SID4944]|nr:hypothetical protein [Streptomyces sp. SID4944]